MFFLVPFFALTSYTPEESDGLAAKYVDRAVRVRALAGVVRCVLGQDTLLS